MKSIKIFLSLILFAVCAAVHFPAHASAPPKIVPIPVKAEKILRQQPTKATLANFVRTDCLVMYESVAPISPATSRYQFQIVESFSVKSRAFSRFFRFKPDYYRRLDFVLS